MARRPPRDDDPESGIGRQGVADLPLFTGRPSPPASEPPVPVEHTETQEEWADREDHDWKGDYVPRILALLKQVGGHGAQPWEVVAALELPDRKIVTVRSCLTILHQEEEIVRTTIKRVGQYVYVHPSAWRPEMGSEPSKPHRGRGSR